MGKRHQIKRKKTYYVERKGSPKKARGQFKKFTNIGKSINVDKRKKAEHHPTESGYGHQGDYR
jgi:hypothetical protein